MFSNPDDQPALAILRKPFLIKIRVMKQLQFNIVLVGPGHGGGVKSPEKVNRIIKYNGKQKMVKLGQGKIK